MYAERGVVAKDSHIELLSNNLFAKLAEITNAAHEKEQREAEERFAHLMRAENQLEVVAVWEKFRPQVFAAAAKGLDEVTVTDVTAHETDVLRAFFKIQKGIEVRCVENGLRVSWKYVKNYWYRKHYDVGI